MNLFRIFLVTALAIAGVAQAQPAQTNAPTLSPGDTWVFDRSVERGTSNFASQRLVFKIERVNSDTMVLGLKLEGSPVDFEDHVVGIDWSQHKIVNGEQVVSGRPFNFPLYIGKAWAIDYTDPTRRGLQDSAEHHETYKVIGWEDVTTPAGSFHALRIDTDDKIKAHVLAASGAALGGVATSDGSTIVAHTDRSGPRIVYSESLASFYYAPSVKYWVKSVEEIFNAENVRVERKTDVLASFEAGGAG